jgi:ATP-dependent exoDNAse (exonuclease V) beta subunit
VQLVEDFITEDKLKKTKEDAEKEKDKKGDEPKKEVNKAKLNEEINLLYVAITRTKNNLHIPEKLMPANFPASPQIKIIKEVRPEENSKVSKQTMPLVLAKKLSKQTSPAGKAYSVEAIRKDTKGAYMPWTDELDKELTVLFMDNMNLRDIAKNMGRTKGAIVARIKKLDLQSPY